MVFHFLMTKWMCYFLPKWHMSIMDASVTRKKKQCIVRLQPLTIMEILHARCLFGQHLGHSALEVVIPPSPTNSHLLSSHMHAFDCCIGGGVASFLTWHFPSQHGWCPTLHASLCDHAFRHNNNQCLKLGVGHVPISNICLIDIAQKSDEKAMNKHDPEYNVASFANMQSECTESSGMRWSSLLRSITGSGMRRR